MSKIKDMMKNSCFCNIYFKNILFYFVWNMILFLNAFFKFLAVLVCNVCYQCKYWTQWFIYIYWSNLRTNPRRYSRHLSVKSYEDRSKVDNKETTLEAVDDHDKICGCIPAGREASNAFKEMMDFSLLKDVIFIMFAISNFLTSIGFNVPYVYTAVS